MRIYLLLFVVLLISKISFGTKITDINFTVDSSSLGHTNTFRLNINLVTKKGKNMNMSNDLHFMRWSKIQVSGKFITAHYQGLVTFDQLAITPENNKIQVEVSYDKTHYYTQTVILPYVTGVTINNTSIFVNHGTPLRYDLIFSNGKTQAADPSLYRLSDIESASVPEMKITGDNFYLLLTEPYPKETVKIILKNVKTNTVLGEKELLVDYQTSLILYAQGANGYNGDSGRSGRNPSEAGGNGVSGQNGASAADVVVMANLKVINNVTYIILRSQITGQSYRVNILKYTGVPIQIKAHGGNGGNGGNGANGMDGKIDTLKKINSPNGGNGGYGGHGGNGGNGGKVSFIFEQESGDLSTYFSVELAAGTGGTAGVGGIGGKAASNQIKINGVWSRGLKGTNGPRGQDGVAGQAGSLGPMQKIPRSQWEEKIKSVGL